MTLISKVIKFVLLLGHGHVHIHRGMTAQPPPAIAHVQGALRDGHHRVGGVIVTSLQGGMRIDDHPQRGAVRDDGLPGGVVTSVRQQRSPPLSAWRAVQRGWRRNYWKLQVQSKHKHHYISVWICTC